MNLQEELPYRNKAAGNTRQEYHAPEPHDEDEDPQWTQTDPEFALSSGDGPDSLEEYNPEKDKAGKRKRNIAEAMRRLRTKRRREGDEKRDRTRDIEKQFESRSQRRKAGEKRECSGDIKKKYQK